MASFYDAIKWYLMSVFLVGGFYFVNLADASYSFRPMMPALLSFGALFISAFVWHKYDRKVQLMSLITLMVTATLAYYLPAIVYIVTGSIFDVPFSLAWLGLNFIIGFPFMYSLFR